MPKPDPQYTELWPDKLSREVTAEICAAFDFMPSFAAKLKTLEIVKAAIKKSLNEGEALAYAKRNLRI